MAKKDQSNTTKQTSTNSSRNQTNTSSSDNKTSSTKKTPQQGGNNHFDRSRNGIQPNYYHEEYTGTNFNF